MNRQHNRIVVAILAGCALIAPPAFATPGSGFSGAGIVNGHFGTITLNTAGEKTDKWGLILKTLDDTDVGADRLTVQPQGHSGWHSHPGPVFVTVTGGTVQWYDAATCTANTYTVGQSYIEPAGRAHNVRNTGGTTAEYVAIVIKPVGFVGPAFRIDEPEPSNCN